MELVVTTDLCRVVSLVPDSFKIKRSVVHAVKTDGTKLSFPKHNLAWYKSTKQGCAVCFYETVITDTLQVDRLKDSKISGFAIGRTKLGKVLVNKSRIKE